MSASAQGSNSTTKAVTSDPTNSTPLKDQQKPAAALEEDDEFEDFPVEGIPSIFSLSDPLHARSPPCLGALKSPTILMIVGGKN